MLKENLIEIMEQKFKEYWYMPLFSDYKQSGITNVLTYKDVADRIIKLHNFFEKAGIKKKDKIALIGRNSSNWAVTFLSIITYCTVVPVLPDFNPEDINHILSHSDSKMLFITEDIYETLDSLPENIETVILLDDLKTVLHSKKEKVKEYYQKIGEEKHELTEKEFTLPKNIKKDDILGILYTSGTTGLTKGVMLTYNNIWANVKFGIDNIDLKPGDRVLSFLPVAHTYALSFDLLTEFFKGVHITFLPVIPSPTILLKALSEIKPRLINTVPLLLEKIYKKVLLKKLKKIKYILKLPLISNPILSKIREKLINAFGGNFIQIITGAAPLNYDIDIFFKKIKLPYTVGYGMTECGPLISYIDYKNYKVGSVGKPIYYLELKIDSNDPYNEPGEILVRGENVMAGYYKNPEETKKVIDKDGWLHTGDIGLLDKEGYLYIKGRIKSLILGPSGKNIYPEAIEAKLDNMEFVTESLVIEKNGKLIALVYPDFEAISLLGLKEKHVNEFLEKTMEKNRILLNQKLPSYSQISKIEIMQEPFEKTPTKKIKRFLYK